MTIFEYLLTASAEKLRNDLKNSGKWRNYHSFPSTKEAFCNFFGLTDDSRICYFFTIERNAQVEVYIKFGIPFNDCIKCVTYEIGYLISGYKNPIILKSFLSDNIVIEFNDTYKIPKDFNFLRYKLGREPISIKVENNKNSTSEQIVNKLITIMPDLNNSCKKTIDALNDITNTKFRKEWFYCKKLII